MISEWDRLLTTLQTSPPDIQGQAIEYARLMADHSGKNPQMLVNALKDRRLETMTPHVQNAIAAIREKIQREIEAAKPPSPRQDQADSMAPTPELQELGKTLRYMAAGLFKTAESCGPTETNPKRAWAQAMALMVSEN
ncbi:MAG: hypothetical protein V1760_00475 [Candidatus Peregrinibacteria bacterium]